MYYWYSTIAGRYYVLDTSYIVHGYASVSSLKHDYPHSKHCPCVEHENERKYA